MPLIGPDGVTEQIIGGAIEVQPLEHRYGAP